MLTKTHSKYFPAINKEGSCKALINIQENRELFSATRKTTRYYVFIFGGKKTTNRVLYSISYSLQTCTGLQTSPDVFGLLVTLKFIVDS